jgi:hypothetical protein
MTSNITYDDIDIVIWTDNDGSAIVAWPWEGWEVKQELWIHKLVSLQLIPVEAIACGGNSLHIITINPST